jgi:xanthine/uracil permease
VEGGEPHGRKYETRADFGPVVYPRRHDLVFSVPARHRHDRERIVENIGVMAVTRIYSTLIFIIAAVVAILLGFCPKFGALIGTIPGGIIGGLAVVLFGLIAVTGGRIWVENRVDFSKSRNLITAAVAVTLGAGMISVRDVSFGLTIGNFTIGGIGVATFGSIILYQILRERNPQPEEAVTADSAVGLDPGAEPQAGAGE